jgi:hypothetical protein
LTEHDLAMIALDDALKAAGDLARELQKARAAAVRKNYAVARSALSDAASAASYLDHHYIRNAASAVEACK